MIRFAQWLVKLSLHLTVIVLAVVLAFAFIAAAVWFMLWIGAA